MKDGRWRSSYLTSQILRQPRSRYWSTKSETPTLTKVYRLGRYSFTIEEIFVYLNESEYILEVEFFFSFLTVIPAGGGCRSVTTALSALERKPKLMFYWVWEGICGNNDTAFLLRDFMLHRVVTTSSCCVHPWFDCRSRSNESRIDVAHRMFRFEQP